MGFFRDLIREFTKPRPSTGDPAITEIADPVFGPLVWSSDPGWWTGAFVCDDKTRFRLTVDAGDTPDRRPPAESREHYAAVCDKIAGCKTMAVEDFLPKFNEEWNDQEQWTSAQLSDLLSPQSVHVWSHGSVEVSFQERGDEELLGGHVLAISFHDDGSTTVGLEG